MKIVRVSDGAVMGSVENKQTNTNWDEATQTYYGNGVKIKKIATALWKIVATILSNVHKTQIVKMPQLYIGWLLMLVLTLVLSHKNSNHTFA